MTNESIKSMMSTGKDDWGTPQELFDSLNEEFHFTLDPCSTDQNAKCEKHYTESDDGLSKDWQGETVFCNPPYSRGGKDHKGQAEWIKKCYEESLKGGTIVVALLPVRTDTKAFHTYIYHKAEVRFLEGRLKFTNGDKPVKRRATFGSMIVVWGGNKVDAVSVPMLNEVANNEME